MKFNIKGKILLGSSAIIILMVVLGVVSYGSLRSLVGTMKWVEHTHEVLENTSTIGKLIVDMETGQRGFLLTGKEEFLEPFESGIKQLSFLINETKELVSDNPSQQKRIIQIEKEITRWRKEAGDLEIGKRREVEQSDHLVSTFKKLQSRTVGKEIFDDIRLQFKAIRSNFNLEKNLKGNVILLELLNSLLDMETGQRGFLLTGKEESLQPFNDGKKVFEKKIIELRQIVNESKKYQISIQNIDQIKFLADKWQNKAALPEIQARRDVSDVSITMEDVAAIIEMGTGKRIIDGIRVLLKKIMQEEQRLMAIRTSNFEQEYINIKYILIFGVLIILIISTVWSFWMSNHISKPLLNVVNKMLKISKGETEREAITVRRSDEVGTLENIFNQMSKNLNALVIQAKTIADGNLKEVIKPQNDKDQIGIALQGMTRKLRNNDIENKKNDWFKTGLNKLNQRMRKSSEITTLAENVISFLAKYLEAQIGVLYLKDKETDDLKLTGSYAFEQKKTRSHIKIGDGLIGQAAYENKIISVTDIPKDYPNISSAVGNALPRNIILAPFSLNKNLVGVIELASFKEFTEKEIEFLNISMESIAIDFLSLLAKEKEKELLLETQRQAEELETQTEELETQQEELRQVNEELLLRTDSLEKQKLEIQESNKRIQEKAEELVIANKYKSEFLANMSHELRTPLNSMLLLSNNLVKNKKGNLDSDQVESMSIIHNGGKSLLNLINEILDLSKIEAGMTTIEATEISIEGAANDLKANFRHMAAEKGLELSISVDENLSHSMVTDKIRLQQILKNFLSNAIKFTDKGSINVNFCRPSNDLFFSKSELDPEKSIAISVADSGIGIPIEKQKLIFEAFQQADSGTSRKYGGTGLGLSISKELANLLGGEIHIQSERDKGSTFTLFLPLDLTSHSSKLQTTEKSKSQKTLNFKPKLNTQNISIDDDRDNMGTEDKNIILIIEDDQYFAQILRNQCADKGLKSIVAPTGEEGVDLANQYFPKGIILDINLPGVDGWFVLNTIKENPRTRHIPVHIMSIDDCTQKATQQGAIGFITKPVSQEKLDDVLSRLQSSIEKNVKEILIIEDDKATVKAITDLIENSEVKVTAVGTGKEALETLNSGQFDCIILDLKLPDMKDFELLDKLKMNSTSPIPPIIVYTGKELSKKENKQLLEYADSIILKGPYSEERLIDETSLFLHQVVDKMPQEKQKIIYDLHNVDKVFKDKRVMVVDDDMRNIFAISQLLQEKDIETIKVESGQAALEFLNQMTNIDLILMDIMMPEMDGYETIHRIRQQEKFKNLPIIALTAKAMRGDREKCIAAGASDYIAKPVEEDRLFSMMRIWLYR